MSLSFSEPSSAPSPAPVDVISQLDHFHFSIFDRLSSLLENVPKQTFRGSFVFQCLTAMVTNGLKKLLVVDIPLTTNNYKEYFQTTGDYDEEGDMVMDETIPIPPKYTNQHVLLDAIVKRINLLMKWTEHTPPNPKKRFSAYHQDLSNFTHVMKYIRIYTLSYIDLMNDLAKALFIPAPASEFGPLRFDEETPLPTSLLIIPTEYYVRLYALFHRTKLTIEGEMGKTRRPIIETDGISELIQLDTQIMTNVKRLAYTLFDQHGDYVYVTGHMLDFSKAVKFMMTAEWNPIQSLEDYRRLFRERRNDQMKIAGRNGKINKGVVAVSTTTTGDVVIPPPIRAKHSGSLIDTILNEFELLSIDSSAVINGHPTPRFSSLREAQRQFQQHQPHFWYVVIRLMNLRRQALEAFQIKVPPGYQVLEVMHLNLHFASWMVEDHYRQELVRKGQQGDVRQIGRDVIEQRFKS